MSKLFNKYQKLKKTNSSKIYLFKSGIFYIFLDDDAKKISNSLGLKLTPLNDCVQKCGFPASKLSKYTEQLNNLNFDYQIIDENLNDVNIQEDYIKQNDIISIVNSIKKLDMNKITPMQAFTLLLDYNKTLNNMEEQKNDGQ
jgi:DNA mismatch repair ATPase MutS